MLENINPKSPLAQTLNKVPFILQIVIGLLLGIIIAYVYPNDETVLPAGPDYVHTHGIDGFFFLGTLQSFKQ